MTQHDLEDALHRLAAGVRPPPVPVADDLARGRARRRRHRLAVLGGAAATLLVVGLGAAVGPELVGADSPGFSGGDPDPLPTRTGAGVTEPTVREIRPSAGPAGPEGLDGPDAMDQIRDHPDLNRYRDVLAEYLDPRGEHLENGVSNMQSGGGSLGTKLAWTNAGESGMGMVQVSVNAGWGAMDGWGCADGWTCHDAAAPGGLRGTVAQHDGVTEVAVEHDDGIVAVISVDALFGNNSTVPVSGIDLGEDLLLRTAADPRLDLPGYEAGVPPLLDQGTFERVGLRLLVAEGEEVEPTYTGRDAEPWVEAEWTDGASRGTLSWEATQSGGIDAFACVREQFTRCEVREVDGVEMFVGYTRPRWGGGWQASHAGASYDVRVTFVPAAAGDELAPDRAFAFVTDPRWQPTR